MQKITSIILCGGKGTRVAKYLNNIPKQFFIFNKGNTLFDDTLNRVLPFSCNIIISSNIEYEKYLNLQLNISYKLLLETNNMNTAYSILLSCLACNEQDIVFITPSDLYIEINNNFYTSLRQAVYYAQYNKISLFGIKPTFPSTQYGYICNKNSISFYEKPNNLLAHKLYKTCYWNSGIIVSKVHTLLDEYKKLYPLFSKYNIMYKNNIQEKTILKVLKDTPNISIDYSILMKSKKLSVIPLDTVWYDLGNLDNLKKLKYI